ncbi:GFA family protein [Metapseudomonas lalkuanensis]|nr:GFA family protein [Pseudomonas lalkuanensis]
MTESFKAVGGCRCDDNPVRYEYSARPAEVHYCLCTDCTDTCGGAMAIIAVVDRNAFKITANAGKLKCFHSKSTCHRYFCSECGCHMYLHVDSFPDFELVHVPTLDRECDAGGKPDRYVFVRSKHPLLTLPDDGLPRHEGWANSGEPVEWQAG